MRFFSKYFFANWKLNKTLNESLEFFRDIEGDIKNQNVFIAPSFVNLYTLKNDFPHIKIGAQTVSSHSKGAYTGEVSAVMLKEIGVDFCIVGHSERRHVFGEKDHEIAKKMERLAEYKITPILCVGETLEQKQEGITFQTIQSQLEQGLMFFKKYQLDLFVAYEPVWAIGSSLPATPEEANLVMGAIKELVVEMMPESQVKLLYGGSVNLANIDAFLNEKHIDGVLVGGASLDLSIFKNFIK
jgi:triosephosphate isomerase